MSPRLNGSGRPLSNCHFQADVWIVMEQARDILDPDNTGQWRGPAIVGSGNCGEAIK